MGALVNNLLDVTRARFGAGLSVSRSMMNMGFVAQQIIDEIRVVNPGRTIELSMSGSLVGEWDKARIGQVFSNLLGNAIQYSFQGSPVKVQITGSANTVILVVGNDGIPIPPEKLKMIFDPLTRGLQDESGFPVFGNLGLGLYITKEVVVAHGGTIEVSSSDRDGTVFMVQFPRNAFAANSGPGPTAGR
jgi:signal transduction histidine kinase